MQPIYHRTRKTLRSVTIKKKFNVNRQSLWKDIVDRLRKEEENEVERILSRRQKGRLMEY